MKRSPSWWATTTSSWSDSVVIPNGPKRQVTGESSLATVLFDPEVLFARSTDGGQSWSGQPILSSSRVSTSNDSLSVYFAAYGTGE